MGVFFVLYATFCNDHTKSKSLRRDKFVGKKILIILMLVLIILSSFAMPVKAKNQLPDNVKNISRQNTYPNADTIPERVQPSTATSSLLNTTNYVIENPNLIRLLNETTIKNSVFSFGKASIYLGNWALSYQSKETTPHWEYMLANRNQLDNRKGTMTQELHYRQNQQFTAKGGLTTPTANEEDVMSLMIVKAQEKSGMNLSYQTTIGQGTTTSTIMKVPPKKVGYLNAYIPAVHEKGTVIYGEVYLIIKGRKSYLEIKNVTNSGVSAWIPIQDYLSFQYQLTDQPKETK